MYGADFYGEGGMIRLLALLGFFPLIWTRDCDGEVRLRIARRTIWDEWVVRGLFATRGILNPDGTIVCGGYMQGWKEWRLNRVHVVFSDPASGGSRLSPEVERVQQPQFITITEFQGYPTRRVIGGPYHSREFAETAAAIARVQLGSFKVPYTVRVEQSAMSSVSTPSHAPDSGEAE
jgi:hypothetical protein